MKKLYLAFAMVSRTPNSTGILYYMLLLRIDDDPRYQQCWCMLTRLVAAPPPGSGDAGSCWPLLCMRGAPRLKTLFTTWLQQMYVHCVACITGRFDCKVSSRSIASHELTFLAVVAQRMCGGKCYSSIRHEELEN